MPKFTIESTFKVPHYRHTTYEADTVEQALQMALEDQEWDHQKADYDSSGDVYISGAWEGENSAYARPSLSVPEELATDDPAKVAMIAALQAVMRCARGELERPVTERQPWGEAERLIKIAFEKASITA